MSVATIVGHVGGSCNGDWSEQDDWSDVQPTRRLVRKRIETHVRGILESLERSDRDRTLDEVEGPLHGQVFALARLFLVYFLVVTHEQSEKHVRTWLSRGFRRRAAQRKYLGTRFGRVSYWRTYIRRPDGQGLHPLDLVLRVSADGFTHAMMAIAARLSTLLSYEQVTGFLLHFQTWSPSKTTVEKSVLGFGRFTGSWFESAPAPDDDGEVLVIQIDSKATPTATEEELEKRRGKRVAEESPASPRHRGRAKRARRGPKKRRKKGDKSKNGKAATIVVMYTLKKGEDKDGKPVLLGPVNKRVYASYAPKRHAFAVARREADKRGFPLGSRKPIQIVTDGDEDFERYVKDFFPNARHTLDIMHVLEYVWEAGRMHYEEGSSELRAWVKKQERRLYRGGAATVVLSLNELDISSTKKARLAQIRGYLQSRLSLMTYDELRKEDLEVGSGAVEGAVRHVIGKRFDSSGMRWIRERAEALLQLRCIEINGDWNAFIAFVEGALSDQAARERRPVRLLTTKAQPLPTFGVTSNKTAA